jgi:hypothetical protein
MLKKEQLQHWRCFYAAARDNEVLDARTTVLVQLASAMSLGCDP